jgi:hypothetical protein
LAVIAAVGRPAGDGSAEPDRTQYGKWGREGRLRRPIGDNAGLCSRWEADLPRILINGQELRRPVARFVLTVVAIVAGAVLLASAAAWLPILLGLGAGVAVAAFAVAPLAGAAALASAALAALFGGRRRG